MEQSSQASLMKIFKYNQEQKPKNDNFKSLNSEEKFRSYQKQVKNLVFKDRLPKSKRIGTARDPNKRFEFINHDIKSDFSDVIREDDDFTSTIVVSPKPKAEKQY